MEMMMKEFSSSNVTVPSFARGLNILLVDNDTTSLMYLASMLEQYSYKVTTTELASVALSMIREDEDRFKLVIANVNMPDMDYFSFLRVLLKKEIPFILMDSKRSLSAARKALAEGACFFLEKPVYFDDLKYIWQHIYKSRKADREMLNHGKISQGIKIKEAADGDLQCMSAHHKGKNKQIMEVDQVVLSDEKCVKERWKEGGVSTKKSLNEDEVGKGKEKKIKLDSKGINYDNLKLFEEIEIELMNDGNEEIEKEMNDNNASSGQKGSRRFIWTPELHLKFTAALSALENKKVRPKLILKMMNVPHLTQRQVASHLQKYKAQVKRNAVAENGRADLPLVQPHEKMIKSSASTRPGRRTSDIAIGGTIQAANFTGNVPNVGNSSTDFSLGHQEVNSFVISAPLTSGSAPAYSANQNQPSPAYADLLKLLDEEEEQFTGVGNGLNPNDVDRYYEWLNEALLRDNHFHNISHQKEPHK